MSGPRTLKEPSTGWRVGDANGDYPVFGGPVFGGKGAARVAGRRHDVERRVIHVATRYGTAPLEKLVYSSGILPPGQHEVEVTVPAACSCEVVNPERIPGWQERSGDASRVFGSRWHEERRSLALIAPSVVARRETNLPLDTAHVEFDRVRAGLDVPVHRDTRSYDP